MLQPVPSHGGSPEQTIASKVIHYVLVAIVPAFVGSIQAADRMIWSALGNTTNLAARLQALTRELDVAAVIDEATWREAGPRKSSFERRAALRIRGLDEPRDVFVAIAS